MLSKKYYRLIAKVIKNSTIKYHRLNKSMINKDNLINDISIEFKRDNTLFNHAKFKDACD